MAKTDIRTIQIQLSQEEYGQIQTRLAGKSVRQYIKMILLRGDFRPLDVVDARDKGKSFGEIATEFRITKGHAHYLYKRYKNSRTEPVIDKRKELGKARGGINKKGQQAI